MSTPGRREVLIAIALCLSVVVGPVGTGPVRAADDGLRMAGELRLTPDRPGEIGVTQRYEIPSEVSDLTATLPTGATVTAASGFDRVEDRQYEWDGTTDRPTLSYRLPVNQTADRPDVQVARRGDASSPRHVVSSRSAPPRAASDQDGTDADAEYLLVDVGPWAIVRLPSTPARIRGTGTAPEFSTEWTVDGEGAVGEAVAFLGEHRERRVEGDGQSLRLVVPAAARADLAASPEAVLSSLRAASAAYRVGARDDALFVATPVDGVEWAARGITVDGRDAWVRADEPLDVPRNIWLHEYVHTRQRYATTEETRWFAEGTATYYAALLSFEQERVGYEAFRDRLARGARDPQSASVLSEPSTWAGGTQYTKGGLVAGDLDRRVRLASGGETSLETAIRRLNEHGERVDAAALYRQVERAGDESVRRSAVRFVSTDDVPEPWERERHRAAFGPLPADIAFAVPAPSEQGAVRASGPYRDAGVGGSRPVVLVPGETIAVDVRVANRGDAAGAYDLTARVGDRVLDRRTGSLDAGESRVETVEREFDAVGTHELTVERTGGSGAARDSLRVSVRRPARASVVAVGVDRTTATVGDPVTVTASVTNGAPIPGRANVTFVADGDPIATRTVRVPPSGTANASATRTFETPGEHALGVRGGGAAIVSVVDGAATSRSTVTDEPVPGFGVSATVAALALAALLARRSGS